MASMVPARITSGSAPITRRLAAYNAAQPPRTASAAAIADRVSPGATTYRVRARPPGSTSTVPGRMTSGSGPISGRLAAYNAAQPPRTASRAAMPDNVSPGCTTYRAAGLTARTDTAATLTVSARMIPVPLLPLLLLLLLLLLAMRVSAWAGWDRLMPAATMMIGRALQASTTHADFVHTRTGALTFLPQGSAPGACGPDADYTDR